MKNEAQQMATDFLAAFGLETREAVIDSYAGILPGRVRMWLMEFQIRIASLVADIEDDDSRGGYRS